MAAESLGPLVVRLVFISAAPLASLVAGDTTVFWPLALLAIFASVVDVLRQSRRFLPFPVFLMLVYAIQLSTYAALGAGPEGEDGAALPIGRPESRGGSLRGAGGAKVIKTLSVVIAAHNEHNYMERTLQSILQQTPADVLTEVIVVDDGSTPPLVTVLTDFPTVRILRHEDRRGLIKSKTEGGNLATGDAIMFLDGHVKPEPKWYVPILRHMNINYKRVVVPVIPILDKDTWKPELETFGVKMMFDWSLNFAWFEDGNDWVPCMSGGLFGITKRWWHESGEYDYGMKGWGAENIEQSIRIWSCGGEIVVARDSKISHVFRTQFPYSVNYTDVYMNKVRTVEVWFDEEKETFYQLDAAARRFRSHFNRSDIQERLQLKKALHCKSFSWYMDKFHDVFKMKHMLPEEQFLLKDRHTGLCVQLTQDEKKLVEVPCNTESANQRWTVEGDRGLGLRAAGKDRCLDANAGVLQKEGMEVLLYKCYPTNEMQAWRFDGGRISWSGFCVQGAEQENLKLRACGPSQDEGPFEKFASEMRHR